jgi:trehalose utilization protein
VFYRGAGKIFYFQPGHETYPIYYQKEIKLIIKNAAKYVAPRGSRWVDDCPHVPAEQAPCIIPKK